MSNTYDKKGFMKVTGVGSIVSINVKENTQGERTSYYGYVVLVSIRGYRKAIEGSNAKKEVELKDYTTIYVSGYEAKHILKNLNKGDQISVTGSLDGTKSVKTEHGSVTTNKIMVESMQVMSLTKASLEQKQRLADQRRQANDQFQAPQQTPPAMAQQQAPMPQSDYESYNSGFDSQPDFNQQS